MFTSHFVYKEITAEKPGKKNAHGLILHWNCFYSNRQSWLPRGGIVSTLKQDCFFKEYKTICARCLRVCLCVGLYVSPSLLPFSPFYFPTLCQCVTLKSCCIVFWNQFLYVWKAVASSRNVFWKSQALLLVEEYVEFVLLIVKLAFLSDCCCYFSDSFWLRTNTHPASVTWLAKYFWHFRFKRTGILNFP